MTGINIITPNEALIITTSKDKENEQFLTNCIAKELPKYDGNPFSLYVSHQYSDKALDKVKGLFAAKGWHLRFSLDRDRNEDVTKVEVSAKSKDDRSFYGSWGSND